MSLEAAILEEAQELTFTRFQEGRWVNGSNVPGATQTFTASFAVQPMNARELLLLPEGSRQRASLKLYGTTELQIEDSGTNVLGDRFTLGGAQWEITAESLWYGVGGHRRYVAQKIGA